VHKVSKSVLVEKFIPGRDYRIVVFRGKAIWAKERRPAGVTGDGKATIRQLVDGVNADPRRGSDIYAPLKKLVLDEEAEKLLTRDGLTFDSVPKKGAFVPLRRRANVSAGGTPLAVTDRMHPDNARVAERAAELVGLDLAGVDLIIPDIAQSWREVPSGICEINAQPELGGDAEHLYAQVLKSLVRNNGHVPTIAVMGGGKADTLVEQLVAALAAQGLSVGSHDRKGVHVGGETIVAGGVSILRAGRMLTMDRRVEVLVFGVIDGAVLQQGLPVQTIDALLLTGDTPPEPEFRGTREPLPADTLRLMAPHCRHVAALALLDELPPPLRAAVPRAIKVNRVVPATERVTFFRGLVKGITIAARKARDTANRG
jgi:cyanophycin synthetase